MTASEKIQTIKAMTADDINLAKALTAEAKSAKAYTLCAADRRLQQVELPGGYIIATTAEVNKMLESVGKKPYSLPESDLPKVWALVVSRRMYASRPKYNITIAAIC